MMLYAIESAITGVFCVIIVATARSGIDWDAHPRWTRRFFTGLLWFTALLGLWSFVLAGILATIPAHAHDRWSNGEPVPAWVKNACCGPSDVHHIPASAVHLLNDGYHVDGITTVIPAHTALPSPDGTFWGFWSEAGEPDPVIYCFFTPFQGA